MLSAVAAVEREAWTTDCVSEWNASELCVCASGIAFPQQNVGPLTDSNVIQNIVKYE